MQVYRELDVPGDCRQFSEVQTPVSMFEAVAAESHILEYTRLPISDDAAPTETVRSSSIVLVEVYRQSGTGPVTGGEL